MASASPSLAKLAELGNAVFLGSRDLEAGEEAAASLRQLGLEVSPVHLDLAVAATVDAAVDAIEKAGRPVDVLVNNAGVLHEKPLLDLTDAEIGESIAVHLTGPIRLVRSLVPGMVAAGTAGSSTCLPAGGRSPEGLRRPRRLRRHEGGAERADRAARQRTPLDGQGKRDVPRLGANAHGRCSGNANP